MTSKQHQHDKDFLVEDLDDSQLYVPLWQRKQQQQALLMKRRGGGGVKGLESSSSALTPSSASTNAAAAAAATAVELAGPSAKVSLMDQALAIKKSAPQKTELELRVEEEQEILKAQSNQKLLKSDKELALGFDYDKPLTTSWRPPRFIREMGEEQLETIRKEFHILVEGDDIPPPIKNFTDMKIPRALVDYLKNKGE